MFGARDGRCIGRIDIADTLRPEARSTVQGLRDMGLPTVLLTGDAAAVARGIGEHLRVAFILTRPTTEDVLAQEAAQQTLSGREA